MQVIQTQATTDEPKVKLHTTVPTYTFTQGKEQQ